MIRDELVSQLQGLADQFLETRGFELVDLSCHYEGRSLVIRLLTDRPEGGITIAECASLNRGLGLLLDEKNILQEEYTLEVSSPGLDRPLKTKSDFLRFLHKKAHLFLCEPVQGCREYKGNINRVGEEYVSIVSEGVEIEIPLARIHKGKLVV